MAFTGFIGPVVILAVKQDSRFVKFHSLQAVIWQAIYMVLVFALMGVFFVAMFSIILHSTSQPAHTQELPPAFVYFFPLVWLGFMGGWVVNLIRGAVYAIKANQGEWAAYPVFGKWLLPGRE